MSQATDRLTASLGTLNQKVDKLIADSGPAAVSAAVDAQATAVADQIDATSAKIDTALTPAS